MQNLVLTGFMGTGKTAVGQEVARRLGRAFVDMDAVIETRAGKSIARIFETEGEGPFRQREAALCRELAAQEDLVIATGGGALVDADNRKAFLATSIVICLNASVDQILARVGAAGSVGVRPQQVLQEGCGSDRAGPDTAADPSREVAVRPLLDVPDPRARIERLLAQREVAYAAIPWQVSSENRPVGEIASDVVGLATARSLSVTVPSAMPGLRHDGGYEIHIGDDTLLYLGGAVRAAGIPRGTRIAVVSNEVVAPLYGDATLSSLEGSGFHPVLCSLPDGEVYKRLKTVRDLYDQLLAHDLDRSGVVLALGGGVTGDIAGFAAATHMRGVPFVQVPTTLLAMTDASVGGKTGVDLPQGKNLVGAFKQPEMVFIDLGVLDTLPPEELRSGMAELLKHAIIGDPQLFEALAGDATVTPGILARSLQVKIDIVEEDPLERGRRAVLNLGHTTGHALERLSHFRMRHGEGVAIGMVVAARIAEVTGRAEAGLADRISAALEALGLPVVCPPSPGGAPLPADAIIAAMRYDKKRRGKRLRWILPLAIGDVVIADDVPDAVVRQVLIELKADG